MNSRKTDFPRWIAWSAVGALAIMTLAAFPQAIPRSLVAVIVVLSVPLALYLSTASAAWWTAIGFAYFLVLSAILLLPLLFRDKRWKLFAGGAAAILLIAAVMINLLLLARWAG